MKRSALSIILMVALAFVSCKKESTELITPGLEVSEKNSVLIAKHTWTGCGPCGGWGYTNFESLMTNYPDEVHVSFTRGNLGGLLNQQIYDFIKDTFNIDGGTPTFHNNLQDLNVSDAQSYMDSEGVVMNANYEMEIIGEKIKLNTTTKFFRDTEGTYLLAPYLIVDSIVAPQSGHPDTPNTHHHKVAVNIAKPLNELDADFRGYPIAHGELRDGHYVNLEFEVTIDPSWSPENISFALMMFKEKDNGVMEFVNVFSK